MDERAARQQAEAERRKREQAVAQLAARLGRRYAPGRATLDAFVCDHPAQKTALAAARRFAAEVAQAVRDGRGLVLYGTVGTGKDHLLAALLYAACAAGCSCSWVNGLELFGKLRETFDTGKTEESVISPHVAPDVLGISDPILPAGDAGKGGGWRTETLYRVLDRRYREAKATWVTINAENADDAEAKLGAPIFDRLKDNADLIPCFWPSHRERR